MTPYRHSKLQHGVAIVMALLLTALTVTLVTNLFWPQQVQIRLLENQRLQSQTKWILRARLDWALEILRVDSLSSSNDTLDEAWAKPTEETLFNTNIEHIRADTHQSNAKLSGYITDAQSLYNLLNLVSASDWKTVPTEVAVYQRILISLKLNPNLAQITANAISATRENGNGKVSKTKKFTKLEDLLNIPGYTPEILNSLNNSISILRRQTPLNINTASAEILAARIDHLSLADATALIERRKRASFLDIESFKAQLLERVPTAAVNKLTTSQISTQTNNFIIHSKLHSHQTVSEMTALVERSGNRIKIIWADEI